VTARGEPPDKDEGRLPREPADVEKVGYQATIITTSHRQAAGTSHPSVRRPHIGRYACGWRDGFRAGAADALRVAGRRLPAEHWHVVEALADAYEAAGE
jgi:hypothetical protein